MTEIKNTYTKDIEDAIDNVTSKVIKISKEEHDFRNEADVQTISKIIRERNTMVSVMQDILRILNSFDETRMSKEDTIESIKEVASKTIGRNDSPFLSASYS